MGMHGETIQLDQERERAWGAYRRVQLRLSYEINRQLQADSDLSMADYDVLAALTTSPGGRLPISVLANMMGWERSRVSHHVKRMTARGLVNSAQAAADRRVTEVSSTATGRRVLDDAAPGHLALIDRLFFGGLPPELLQPLTHALENVYGHVLEHGTLPAPPPDLTI
jgi:DNA-binding MarR family transcriptional regulator